MLATIFVILLFITEQSVELVSAKPVEETKPSKTCAENEEHSICGQILEPKCGPAVQLLNPVMLCPLLPQCVDSVHGLHLNSVVFIKFHFKYVQICSKQIKCLKNLMQC